MATIIAFHAHPDDEVVLTGGTLARLASEGHRTVIVVACDGVMGEAVGKDATLRLDELRASAHALGVARVVHLGYADSGHGPVLFPDPADRPRFPRAPIDQAAARLAEVCRKPLAVNSSNGAAVAQGAGVRGDRGAAGVSSVTTCMVDWSLVRRRGARGDCRCP
jgi:hypothetical protein